MNNRNPWSYFNALVAIWLICASNGAYASLIDRGDGLIYDTDRDVTWVKNANFGMGSSYDALDGVSDGNMTWQNAQDWAASLVFGGYEDWRLPTLGDLCEGANCTGSDLGHLFYVELGNIGFPDAGWGLSNTGPFENVYGLGYWLGAEYGLNPNYAWNFNFASGIQTYREKNDVLLAWAVRDGDVLTSVPVPAAAWLLSSGLLLIGARVKRQKWGKH